MVYQNRKIMKKRVKFAIPLKNHIICEGVIEVR